jgi:hypothetical protein
LSSICDGIFCLDILCSVRCYLLHQGRTALREHNL